MADNTTPVLDAEGCLRCDTMPKEAWVKIPKVAMSFYEHSKFSYDGTTLSWGPGTLKLWINNISKNIAPGSIVIPADFHYIYVTVDDFVTPGVLITLNSIIYTGVNTLTEKDIIIGFVSKQGVGNEARFNLLYGLDHEHEHDGFDSHKIDYPDLTNIPSSFAPSAHNHAGADINSGTIDGDRLPATSTTKKGGVPATGTPSGLFLKDDGTWATPSGGGAGSDTTAIHDDTADEINAIATSLTPADADVLIAEDADAVTAWSKAKLTMSNLYNYIKAKTDLVYAAITHASTHSDGGADEITVQNLGSGAATDGQLLAADGSGGLDMAIRYTERTKTIRYPPAATFGSNISGYLIYVHNSYTSVETSGQIRMPKSKVTALCGLCTAYTGGITFTIRKNGVDTAITGTVSATGVFKLTGDVDFADGDLLSVAFSVGPGNSFTAGEIGILYKTEVM